jgi:DNA helicase II / ATP-dependent DNA helicase PcrA
MENLNKEQREAVETTEGPVLILAGAGSGKTRVIIYRIAHLIKTGVRPDRILAVTFTNKAAQEMKERIHKLAGDQSRTASPLISTFHSLCVRILRRDVEKMQAGYTRNFTIYDSDDQARLVRAIMKDMGIDDKSLNARAALSAISGAKNRSQSPASFANQADYASERTERIAQIYKQYEQRLAQANAMDFDDLLIKTVELLRKVPEVRANYHERFAHVMIDEFQDTNAIQYELARLIAVGSSKIEQSQIDEEELWKGRSFCVVGDLDQCIPAGSLVLTAQGYKPIETIQEGEQVISASGHSRTIKSTVERVKTKSYTGRVVEIKTEGGKILRATPNHIIFGKVNPLPDKHIVYLMYRADKGYRIGRSLGARSQARGRSDVFGLQVRCNQEHANKMWILKVCDSKSEAAYFETFYASKYGIPTMIFHLCGRDGIIFSQEQIDQLYREIDTRGRVQKIFEDFHLFEHYPHLKPKTRFDANRFNANLVMFGDGRTTANAPWGGHRIQFATSDTSLRPIFEDAGILTRDGKKRTWRHESARVIYKDAYSVIDKIQQLDSRIDLVKKASLVEGERSFYEFPASHFHAGMSIATYTNGMICEDRVLRVSFSDYQGKVYDLDIENVHNFICEDVVCHNSIYAFRGSDFNIILGFQKDFKGTKLIKLEQNYRSTQTILEAANKIIEQNSQRLPKTLYASEALGKGETIQYYQSYDGDGEASFVGEKIQDHLRRDPNTRCAVLYRTNAQSRLFEEALRRRNIAYNIVGGFSFYERAEIKDVIAYLKLAMNPHDDMALMRIINSPPRGIGKTTLDAIQNQQRDLEVSMWEAIRAAIDNKTINPRAAAALEGFRRVMTTISERVTANESLSEIVKAAASDTGYVRALQEEKSEEAEGRLYNIEELVSAAVEAEDQGETLRDFIDHAALVSDTDQYKEDSRVTLMSIHAAKGLEFPVVFMVGLEENLFPHSRANSSETELEEERRLCYVAITRAQKNLYISHAMRRRTWGEELPTDPSRFLNEIPVDLLKDVSLGPSWLKFSSRPETKHNREAAAALRGETPPPPVKKVSNFSGKTYNSVDSINDFFKRRINEAGAREQNNPVSRPPSSGSQQQSSKPSSGGNQSSGGYRVGAKVRHAKYGQGMILKVEGAGDEAKLTVSFPGYGQKKFVAKFAALEKA